MSKLEKSMIEDEINLLFILYYTVHFILYSLFYIIQITFILYDPLFIEFFITHHLIELRLGHNHNI